MLIGRLGVSIFFFFCDFGIVTTLWYFSFFILFVNLLLMKSYLFKSTCVLTLLGQYNTPFKCSYVCLMTLFNNIQLSLI